MCKKVLKCLWWCLKWYLKLNVLYWAFIGLAEAATCVRIADPYLEMARKTRNRKLRGRILIKCNIMILENAIIKWKRGLGLNDEAEKKESEA